MEYFKELFTDRLLVLLGALWSAVYRLIFPDESYLLAAGAVLVIMCVDLLTKIYALSRQAGGLRKAVRTHRINSSSFAKGTMDKLIVYGIMLIVCGAAYRITPISELAIWFTQLIFTIMFLRDVLSIIENLTDAGVTGLTIFRKAVKRKMDNFVENVTGEKAEESNDAGSTRDL